MLISQRQRSDRPTHYDHSAFVPLGWPTIQLGSRPKPADKVETMLRTLSVAAVLPPVELCAEAQRMPPVHGTPVPCGQRAGVIAAMTAHSTEECASLSHQILLRSRLLLSCEPRISALFRQRRKARRKERSTCETPTHLGFTSQQVCASTIFLSSIRCAR
jgi:hypothetical protein